MEQNNPLYIAFQQGYARRNSNNFSRDWDEFKTNHADLFQPPFPVKPSVNGELLGFLEIEIEKANKNGKACNLKDGDLNRAQAWYSAAEAFSIVKNKITELSNTPHGHESNIINCPSCNTVWDLSRHNSCQCGATLVTKASPAKAEQEGPWKYEVHHDLGPEDTDEWVTITDGRVTLRFDQHEDEEGEEKVVALLNQLKAKISFHDNADIADYYKEQLDELRAQQKREGPKPISSYLREYSQLKEYEKLLGGGMRPEYTLEQVKAMGWQEVLHMLTGYVDILNLMDGTIHALEERAAQWEAEAKERQREQEGLRWVKASERVPDEKLYVKLVHLQYTIGKTTCKTTGYYRDGKWYRQNDKELEWAPGLEWLDEFTTPVKEAGQPAGEHNWQYFERVYGKSDRWTQMPAMTKNEFKHQIELAFSAGKMSVQSRQKTAGESAEFTDAMVDAVYEGSALWQQEYDACRKVLQELVALKVVKDAEGKTVEYQQRQPKAWEAAIRFLNRYQHFGE